MIEQIVLVGIIVGLTQIIKTLGADTRYIPLVAIALGIFLNALSGFAGSEIIIGGIIAGLISMGLYDTSKVIKK